MRNVFLISLLIIPIVAACQLAKPTTLVMVRHADRQGEDLSPDGVIRAAELRRVLVNAGIDAIYSTDTPRTRRTAQPLATAISKTVEIYTTPVDVISRILTTQKGKKVLIVGHSNTLDDLISACGCTPGFTEIGENTFDNLFIVSMQKEKVNGSARVNCVLMPLKYGAVSH